MNQLTLSSTGTADPATPVGDQFELFVHGLKLSEVRDLTQSEKLELYRQGRIRRRIGLAGLLGIGSIVPLVMQWSDQLRDRGAASLSVNVAMILSMLAATQLQEASKFKKARGPLHVFAGAKHPNEIYYFPETRQIWKERRHGKMETAWKVAYPVKVASNPRHRPDATLTDLEREEIEETLRANPHSAYRIFSASAPSQPLLKRFHQALRNAGPNVVRDQYGNEWLSTGLIWTEGGQPARWRYEHCAERFSPVYPDFRRP